MILMTKLFLFTIHHLFLRLFQAFHMNFLVQSKLLLLFA